MGAYLILLLSLIIGGTIFFAAKWVKERVRIDLLHQVVLKLPVDPLSATIA